MIRNLDDSPKDYSKPEEVIGYCSESLAQMKFVISTNLHLAREAENPTFRRNATERLTEALDQMNFLNGIMGRVVQLQGAGPSSLYHDFNTPDGNQIDIFLREIGYLKG